MPELPEVETVRRGLAPVMEGAQIIAVKQNRPDLRFPFPDRFAARLKGVRVDALARRAKYLAAHLSSGDTLIMHLGMTGSFRIEQDEQAGIPGRFHYVRSKDHTHDHVIFHFNNAMRVTYNDPRRFGFMVMTEGAPFDAHPLIAHLGVEPLGNGLSAAYLNEAFKGRTSNLKAALMDQRIIAGLGNIYVCEALFRAGLSPRRKAGTLSRAKGAPSERLELLCATIRTVLDEALQAGGSTLRDYMHTDGSLGYFQHRFAVYDREGEPCATPGCTRTVSRIVQQGRSTFFCPSCQR